MKTLELTETINIQNIVEDVSFALNKYGKHLKRHNGRKKLIKRLNRFENFRVLIDSFDFYEPLLNIELEKNKGNFSPNLIRNWNWVMLYAENQLKAKNEVLTQQEEKMDEFEEEAEKMIAEQEGEGFFGENLGKILEFFDKIKNELTYLNTILILTGTCFTKIKKLYIFRKSKEIVSFTYHILDNKVSTLYELFQLDKKIDWFKKCCEKYKWLNRFIKLSVTVLVVFIGIWVVSHGIHLLKNPMKFIMKMVRGNIDFFTDNTPI